MDVASQQEHRVSRPSHQLKPAHDLGEVVVVCQVGIEGVGRKVRPSILEDRWPGDEHWDGVAACNSVCPLVEVGHGLGDIVRALVSLPDVRLSIRKNGNGSIPMISLLVVESFRWKAPYIANAAFVHDSRTLRRIVAGTAAELRG
jgi:hypothetical protein